MDYLSSFSCDAARWKQWDTECTSCVRRSSGSAAAGPSIRLGELRPPRDAPINQYGARAPLNCGAHRHKRIRRALTGRAAFVEKEPLQYCTVQYSRIGPSQQCSTMQEKCSSVQQCCVPSRNTEPKERRTRAPIERTRKRSGAMRCDATRRMIMKCSFAVASVAFSRVRVSFTLTDSSICCAVFTDTLYAVYLQM